jgi:RNA-dependent RNA polymerase
MLLEDLGVNMDAFLALQDQEVAKARTIHDSIDRFLCVLQGHSLGRPFRFSYLIKQLQDLGVEINNKDPDKINVDTPFLKQVREVAMMDIMRDIKHSARILVPNSRLLVGIADEGPAYVKAGFENVYCLEPGFIYGKFKNPETNFTLKESLLSLRPRLSRRRHRLVRRPLLGHSQPGCPYWRWYVLHSHRV